jgi:hypothetical protein
MAAGATPPKHTRHAPSPGLFGVTWGCDSGDGGAAHRAGLYFKGFLQAASAVGCGEGAGRWGSSLLLD